VAVRIVLAGLLIAVAAGGAVWLHGYDEKSSSFSFLDASSCVLRNGGDVEERGPLAFLQQTKNQQPGRDLTITCGTTSTSTSSHPSWYPVTVAGAIVLVTLALALVVPPLMRGRSV